MDSLNDASENCKMPFPYKLYQMLEDAEEKGFRHIVSWNSSGKSFKVHDSTAFTKNIIPKYFKQTRYKSFQRQLCLYGFDRVLTGHQKGSRYHPKFVRDNYELMSEIKYCMGAKSKTMQQDLSGHKEGLKSKVLEPSPEKLSPLPDTHTTTQSPVSPIICIRNPANFTYPSSVDARVISPTMSPVNSNNEIVANPGSFWYEPDLTLLSDMQDLDDFGLFEGQAFHFIDPSMHNEVKGEKTEMKMLLPEPAVPSWSLNKMLKDVLPCTASSEELCDAWQKGFEHALSMPFDSSYWP